MSTIATVGQLNRISDELNRNMSCTNMIEELVKVHHQTIGHKNPYPITLHKSFPKFDKRYDTRCQKRLMEVMKPLLDTNEVSIIYRNSTMSNEPEGIVTISNRTTISID